MQVVLPESSGSPASQAIEVEQSNLRDFLKSIPDPDMSQYPQFSDDKLASFSGHGTLEALQKTRLLEAASIPCCICGVVAVMYYGAGRVILVRLTLQPRELICLFTSAISQVLGLGDLRTVLPGRTS